MGRDTDLGPSSRADGRCDTAGTSELVGVEPLWYTLYYDGPVSGVALWDNKPCYFFCLEEDADGERVYALVELTHPEALLEMEQQLQFERGSRSARHTMSEDVKAWLPQFLSSDVRDSNAPEVHYMARTPIGTFTWDVTGKRSV